MYLRYLLLGCFLAVITGCQPVNAPKPSSTLTHPELTTITETYSPVATALPTPTTLPAPTSFSMQLEPVISGLVRPTYLADARDGTGRLFVTEQSGRILIISNGQLLEQPFLDLTDRVSTSANERGLLSMAFSPTYTANGQFYVYYTRQPDNAVTIARYTVSASDPNIADPSSASVIFTIEHPQPNHNGGQLQFGPDGYLYFGTGDGGGQGDQHGSIGNGQNLAVYLGKLLRLDVNNAQPYADPETNPFINTKDARPEIWAYGLRNPWRFTFDRLSHDLYIADVGQDKYEEVDIQPAASKGGENYGWRIMEGMHCYNPSAGCDPTGLVLPVVEYSHVSGNCSITGGYVYRGKQYPLLNGVYFFGDYCSGKIWSLQRDPSGHWQMTERLDSDAAITSFGEDQGGELYVVDQKGTIYRLAVK
jgi:glucose/arabinose dehydrogenase